MVTGASITADGRGVRHCVCVPAAARRGRLGFVAHHYVWTLRAAGLADDSRRRRPPRRQWCAATRTRAVDLTALPRSAWLFSPQLYGSTMKDQDLVSERAFYDELFDRNPENEHITSGYDDLYD